MTEPSDRRFGSVPARLVVAAIASGYLILALFDGGFGPQALGALTIATWVVVLAGLALGRLPRNPVPRPVLAAGLALLAFGVLTAVSITYTSDTGGAFEDLVRIAGYAGLFALITLTTGPGEARPWIVGLSIALVGVAVISVAGRVLVELPGDRDLYEQLPAAQGLLSYPIGYWNGLAACMAAAVTLLAWLSIHLETPRGRIRAATFIPLPILVIYLASSRGGALAAGAGLAVLIWLAPDRHRQIGVPLVGVLAGVALAVFASYLGELRAATDTAVAEREGVLLLGAILIACAGVSAFGERGAALFRSVQIPRLTRRQAVVSGGLIVVGGLLALGPGGLLDAFQDPVVSAQAGSGAPAELASAAGRYQYWEAALGAFLSEPLAGVGSSGFEVWWNLNGDLPRTVSQAHSLGLESLAELGLLGFFAILAFFIPPLRNALLAARLTGGDAGSDTSRVATLFLALLVGGFVISSLEWTWDIPAAVAPVLIAAALSCSVLPPPESRPGSVAIVGPTLPRLPRPGFGSAIALSATGIVALSCALTLVSSRDHLETSRIAQEEGRFDAAVREAREAALLQPWASEPRRRLAQIEQDAGNLGAAQLELEAAIERTPEDFALWLLAADLQERLGNSDAARIALQRAEALNPRSPIFSDVIFGRS